MRPNTLTPAQISDIQNQLRQGKKPSEISRKKNADGSITWIYWNEDVRAVRSQMRKVA